MPMCANGPARRSTAKCVWKRLLDRIPASACSNAGKRSAPAVTRPLNALQTHPPTYKESSNDKNARIDRFNLPLFINCIWHSQRWPVSGFSGELDVQNDEGRHGYHRHSRKHRHDKRARRVSDQGAIGRIRQHGFRPIHHQSLVRQVSAHARRQAECVRQPRCPKLHEISRRASCLPDRRPFNSRETTTC